MTPMEAWEIISKNLTELCCLRTDKGLKSHTPRELDAQILCYKALKQMEESEGADND